MIAIDDLWREHRPALRRFVARRVRDRHDAEDIVQDVFVKAQESLHQLRAPDRAGAWLARIAAHRIVDQHRARKPTEELPDDLAAAEPVDDPVVALAPCLPGMIERLPQAYRAALQLSEIEGLPQREVAQRLGLSFSGAKSRVQRGRTLLRRSVERCCHVFMSGRRIVGFEPVGCCRG
jgi:RNA polymerase sigma-70 factor (ECF subfamily)